MINREQRNTIPDAVAASPGEENKRVIPARSAAPPSDTFVAVALFIGFSILYLLTLCRTIYMGDSGEISTAIATNGIIHPPGYPIFGLLGRIMLALVPVGEPAFRIGCIVALAGGAAVAMLYKFCRELEAGPLSSAAAAATFGASYAFWSQCVRVEVYSLHALLCGIALWGALRYGKTGSVQHLYLAAVAFSLGLAHHLTIVLLLPALLVLAGTRLWTTPRAVTRVGAVIATILAVGPAFWLLLMYWARQEPLINWGRPVTFDALFRHVSGRMYSTRLQPPTPEKLIARLGEAAHEGADVLLWIGIPLLVLGIMLLWKRAPRIAGGLALGAAAVVTYNQFYGINDILVYYIPVWWIAFAFVAVGLESALAFVRTRPASLKLVSACCLLLPIVQIARNYTSCNLSHVTFVRDFGKQKLEHVAKNGILILQNDNDIAPVHYMHFAMGVRPDVTPIERNVFNNTFLYHDIDPTCWYLYSLRRRGIDVPTEVPEDRAELLKMGNDAALMSVLNRLSVTRPLHTTFLDDRSEEQRRADQAQGKTTVSPLMHWFTTNFQPVPQGLVIRLYRRDEHFTLPEIIAVNKSLWENTALPDTSHQRFEGEMDSTYFTDYYATMLLQFGHLYELNREPSEAASVYTLAQQVAPGNESVRTTWDAFRQKYHPVSR